MGVFRLEALPAREGDCLLLSYGEDKDRLSRIVVDAGHSSTGKALVEHLDALNVTEIELLVVTHVDADHIEGVLDFLEAIEGRVVIGDVWFNGWRHLRDGLEGFGPAQGERLTTLVSGLNWNGAVGGRAVRLGDDGAPVPLPALPGGMRMTVLSPSRAKLAKMEPVWEKACSAAGLVPGEGKADEHGRPGLEPLGGDVETLAARITKDDTAPANGTSIALLAEFGGVRVLLGADAHPDVLTASLKRLDGGAPVRLDLFKLPHHGSQANVTRELMAAVDCRDFLVSTDGSKFNHPDETAIARVVASRTDGVHLLFNYRQERTTMWEQRVEGERKHPFDVCFPDAVGQPLVVEFHPA